jgi:DNA gyrase subunit A
MADKENNPENPELFENSSNDAATGAEQATRDKLRNITMEMEESYLNYAMSVIVSRALPDVRDGLKPVHRRILFAMNGLGLRSSSKFRKSATVVGEVLGKYHPHGDTAVYDSMVRMAQDFAMRYMLVNGQGNFGSIDGDSPAAMRYTEAKMQKITEELLQDIDKDTVDFRDNYDGSHQEPVVLPAKVPQLLLNGSMGIAVAMATSIPPHNLVEICDATIHVCDNPDADLDDLMEFIKGPDFPTGATIYDTSEIKNMYATGRGGVVMRAKARIIDMKHGKSAIIVSELPYQVNKANLVSKIADLVRDKKIINITDIRDESNREGIRVVIELKKDSYPKKILQQLYKMTPLQSKFNMNMIALVDGIQPRLLNLKQVLEYFVDHRKIVVTRRTKFELNKAEARAHILEGLKIALDNIDEVIATIKAAPTKEEAGEALMTRFKLSELQSKAILEMRLQTLAGLERKKIEDEYNELMEIIKDLKAILADPQRVLEIIKEELSDIRDKYGDERRTDIVETGLGKITSLDTVPNEPMIITLTKGNYVKRMLPSNFKVQNRGGKGIKGMETKEDDQVKLVKFAHNHDNVLFFTDKGKVYQLRVFDIPQASRTAKGQAIVNLLPLQKDESVTSVLIVPSKQDKGQFLIMGTKNGTIKKTAFKDFENVRRGGLIAIKLKEGDSLNWVKEVNKDDEVVMVTRDGKCIRFQEEEVRPMGRTAQGVRGIKLKTDDLVIEMDVLKDDQAKLLVVMENGLGKATALKNYRAQHRGGTGVKTANVTAKTGKVIGTVVIKSDTENDILLLSQKGIAIRLSAQKVPSQGRATQGVYIMRLKGDDKVTSLSVLPNTEEIKNEQDQLAAAADTKKTKAPKQAKLEV